MKDRKLVTSPEPIPLVILLPAEDHHTYTEARRVLRFLMGRRAPSIEKLLLHDLRGRDADGIADNYLDSIKWPLEKGRSITVRMREKAVRDDNVSRRTRSQVLKLAKPPADPACN